MDLNLDLIVSKIKNKEAIKGLYLWGKPGVGKTHFTKQVLDAISIKIEFGNYEKVIFTQFPGQLIVWPQHIANLKRNMDKEKLSEYNFNNNDLYNKSILIIDDIGGEIASDWALGEILFPLINYRIENKLTTFFTSNFSIAQLESHYLKRCSLHVVLRVIDRIYGLTCEQEITGKNWRHDFNN